MKKILQFLTSRVFIIGVCIVAQFTVLILGILYLSRYGLYMYVIFTLASVITIVYVVSKQDNPTYKLAWVIPIALFPLLGWLLYLLAGRRKISPWNQRHLDAVHEATKDLAPQDESILMELEKKDRPVYRQVTYLHNVAELPLYKNTQVEYLSPGEAFFERLCEELEKAERFIFMEHFIIQEGQMWNAILDILARKVRQGVEVKFMYDDFGSLMTVPGSYERKLKKLGIETHRFNVFRPSIDIFMNYRDHRKIAVIDGNVGFTGGNNLADEYINAYPKHGHWKDAHIMLKGDAVWSLSVLFLQMWQFYGVEKIDYDRYRPTRSYPGAGYVLCYGDSPLDSVLVGEMAYMNMIENAQHSISINTPYLILDNEMTTALCKAARSGVRVQIVTPGVADKWYVHMVTRYNYKALVEAGVEIYEYTPGFIHAKSILVDDEIGIVGSQNFDFRSFYLHFECGAFLYQTPCLKDLKEDHRKTISVSRQIELADCRNKNWFVRVLQVCLNLFAPLM